MKKLRTILLWIFCIFMGLGTLVYLPHPASLLFAAGCILSLPIPKVRNFLAGKHLRGWLKGVLLAAIFVVACMIAPSTTQSQDMDSTDNQTVLQANGELEEIEEPTNGEKTHGIESSLPESPLPSYTVKTPAPEQTAEPTIEPTVAPTPIPTPEVTPTPEPVQTVPPTQTVAPTSAPTPKPTAAPTPAPASTPAPTPKPTQESGGNSSNSGGSWGESSTTNEITGSLDRTAYWTRGGKSYHFSADCPSLSKSTNIQTGTLQDALNAGKKDPCNNCAGGS